MKKLKRLLVSIVLLAMLITLLITPGQVGAFTSDAQKCATLNLLKGDAGVTEAYLAKTSTRLQSAIISLRLSGLEVKALAFKGSATFTDAGKVNWEGGRNILAYLKAHPELGWVGNPDGSFKPNDKINAQAMHKVLLEVLGYKQGVDFTWGNVISFARSHGFSKTLDASTFTNTNIASAVVEALNQKSKGSDIKFVQTLVNSCVVTAAKAAAAGFTVTSIYPVKTNVTLKYWTVLSINVSPTASNLGDTPFAKGLTERTGIKVEFIHPATDQQREQLNIMLATGDLPDIIEYEWYNFPGGPEKIIKEGYVLKLNDAIDKYSPNLKKYLNDNPEIEKMVKTDSGAYYVYPFIRGDDLLMVWFGSMIRKDWLDDVGLKVPTTIDEWYAALKAFKEKKDAQAPLSFTTVPATRGGNLQYDEFIGAFGIGRNFYVDNGKIKYGPAQPAFKDFVATFRKWYKEGLIDKNIATVDLKTLDGTVTSGNTGATMGGAGGVLGKYLTAMKDKDPRFNMVPAPHPVLKKGDTPKFGQKDMAFMFGGTPAITPKSKNVEIAARFLDYGYSDEGRMYYNFGTEGVSYKMENGYPKYTDIITKNPDKLPLAHAMSRYIRGNYNGPFIQDRRYIEQYYAMPQQKDALTVWKSQSEKTNLPRITPTAEESTEVSKIISEVDAFVNESFFKFILGTDSMDNFDKYYDRLKNMNIDKAVAIYQSALERYYKR